MGLLERVIEVSIALIVLMALAPTILVGLGVLNLTDVGGVDLSFVIVLLGIGLFVGTALMVYYHMLGKGKK